MNTIDELKARVDELTEENTRLKIERDIALMDAQMIKEANSGDDEHAIFYRDIDKAVPFDIDAWIADLERGVFSDAK